MEVPNLTREQAQQRALLEVDSYAIDLDLTDGFGGAGENTFSSMTTVRFRCPEGGVSTWIDLVAHPVEAVLNGETLDLSGYRPGEGITLSPLAEHNELTVLARCFYMNTAQGLHRFVDPVDQEVYLYTQFEPADAKRVFACFDQPDLKATYQMNVLAPAGWMVLSNTAVKSARRTSDGAVKHVFERTRPMSTYLVAVVAGPWAKWRDEYHDELITIPLGLYCRASLAGHMDAERLFAETRKGFDFYHRTFGVAYPFGKYDQCFVPELHVGGMENTGCVTFTDDHIFRGRVIGPAYERRRAAVLHELAHMWFGNLVTMRWWDDLWLNEAFATFVSVLAQAEATDHKRAWTTFANVEKAYAYQLDRLPSTHPVAADVPDLRAVELNFDGITYAKGASVLKQLVAFVGLESFLSGVRTYLSRHSWRNATLADLLTSLEEKSGRDLSWWSAQWLETTGVTTLRPMFSVDDEDRFTEFAVTQSRAHLGGGEPRTHRVVVGVYDDDGTGRLVRAHRYEADVIGKRTELPELAGVHRGLLILVNDDDLAYVTIRVDPESLTTLISRIGDVAESLPRALCWSAAWEMTQEAELRARDFVALVGQVLAVETEVGVVQRLLQQAHAALENYGDPVWARTGWQAHIGLLLDRAAVAEPGSDHQLGLVHAMAVGVLDDAQLDTVRGWLDGSAPLAGLVVDSDLRWRLTQALVAHGRAGVSEIEAELERDSTATGRRQAERARALQPSQRAKQEAWQRAVHDDGLSNATVEAIISGFSHPAQRALLAPFTSRYFTDVADVWRQRTGEAAQRVALLLFPSWAISEETVAAANVWLADDTHPSTLRSLVADGRDRMVRALAVRAFDRSEEQADVTAPRGRAHRATSASRLRGP
ncbi:aminopeptidase N [Actinomadura sp. KC06]|uniref:aminopeptidase N n=1 Tax=Actinomadura sp. KC06 TaxID=2530369 RepID=UPI0010535AFC|nr:aminopeptidase N [Actinomadura sp. KC06]TDD28770.1 aminopeptidase N [Actinomadura sp. KC06]